MPTNYGSHSTIKHLTIIMTCTLRLMLCYSLTYLKHSEKTCMDAYKLDLLHYYPASLVISVRWRYLDGILAKKKTPFLTKIQIKIQMPVGLGPSQHWYIRLSASFARHICNGLRYGLACCGIY